jgi:hypothetical protein
MKSLTKYVQLLESDEPCFKAFNRIDLAIINFTWCPTQLKNEHH